MNPGTSTAFVVTFIALQLSGTFLFALILLSAWLWRGARRHRIFFNFCGSWIVYTTSYSLLMLGGQQFRTPDRILCTVQAALIYAVPFLVMGTSLGMAVHLLLGVWSALKPLEGTKRRYPTLVNVLLTLPWIIWAGMFIGVLLFGVLNPRQVNISPNGTYCVIEDSYIPRITAVGVTVGGLSVIITEAIIGTLLYRNRAISDIFSNSLTMAIRVLVFTILGFGALSVGLVFAVTRRRGVQFDVIIAILPPAAALTFGTQKDLLTGWRRRHMVAQPEPPNHSLFLTSIQSFASRTMDAHAAERRNWDSRPQTPNPIPNEAASFLHF